jgi:hypothetical protein
MIASTDTKRTTTGNETRQRRRELIAAGLFVFAFATVPIFRTELFPFSRAPMFSDAPVLYCEYTINDPECRELDARAFGLHRNYWGNPLGVGVGYQPVHSLDRFGHAASGFELIAHIQDRLADHPDLPYVEVTQTVIEPIDDLHIGPTEWMRWHIDNPRFREKAR